MADNDDGLRGRVRRAVSGAASTATRAASVAAGRSTSRGPAAPSDEGAAASTAAPATRPAPATKAAPAKKAAPARRAPAPTKAAPTKKAPAKRAARGAAGPAPGTAAPGTVAGSTATGAESSTAQRQTAPTRGTPAVDPASLAVREDEDPWALEELAEVRGLLEADADRFEAEITDAEATLADMLSEGDNGGEDQADTGTKTFEREHEMSLMAGHREALAQTERALSRLDDGSYGVCESCGLAIGKARLRAFPRATLCVACKQREERR